MNKRGIVLVFVFLIFASVFVSGAKVSSEIYESLSENETVRVFVKIAEEPKNLRSFSTKSLEESKGIKDKLNVIHDFGDVVSVELNRSQIEELENSSEVLEIYPVEVYHLFLDSSVPAVSGNSVWRKQVEGINLTGTGETVCVIDSGVDFTHSWLIGRNLTCIIDCFNKSCVEDCSVLDWQGHGTHVSGIIASQDNTYKGISPSANLIGVRACDNSKNCYIDAILKGIIWCIENSSKYNISVISMSFGGGGFYGYCDGINMTSEINLAVSKNISVVVATGNEEYTDKIAAPACIENSIRVSNIQDNRLIYLSANRGIFFEDILFAPGVNVYSTIPGGTFDYKSGTSMSTPHVSGAIAILNQYRRLEGLPKLTPLEIKNLLVDSGENLYDSASKGNYTILNVSSLILSADESSPKIVLNNLENNSKIQSGETNFSFNVSDLQTTNVSFYLWNSSNDLIDNTNFSFDGNLKEFEKSLNLERGKYFWGIYAIDSKGNEAYSENYTLYSEVVLLNFSYPEEEFVTSNNFSEFICEFSSAENELSNVTFYLWNSSDLIYNETTNISGNYNSSTFNWSFESEEEYLWMCEPRDLQGFSVISLLNNSFIYDSSPPAILLTSPGNNSAYAGSQNIAFSFSVTEENLNNCNLYLDNSIVSTNNFSTSGEKYFWYSASVGTHLWKIECIDKAANSNFSEERQITINPAPVSSGGGGSSSTIKKEESKEIPEIILSSTDLQKGITKSFSKGQSANFSIKGEKHRIIVKDFYEKTIYLDIFSEPLSISLDIYETKKIDLNLDKIYDLEIIYSGIYQNKSSLFLKEIEEKIPEMRIFQEENITKEEIKSEENNATEEKNTFSIFLPYFVIIILSFLGLLIIIKIVKTINVYIYS